MTLPEFEEMIDQIIYDAKEVSLSHEWDFGIGEAELELKIAKQKLMDAIKFYHPQG